MDHEDKVYAPVARVVTRVAGMQRTAAPLIGEFLVSPAVGWIMRAFVSVDLPDDLAAPIEALQQRMAEASGLTFTSPEQAHVTLKFLGEIDDNRVGAVKTTIAAAVGDADVGPFDATFGGIGAFPSEDYIRVVWLGVKTGSTQLTQLHDAIERRTTGIGFEPEEHEFTPHVTLARMEHAGGKDVVQRVLADDPTVGSMHVEEVRLTESTLTATGPRYSTVARFPLAN